MDRIWCGEVYFTLCHLSWCCLMWNVSCPGGFSDRSLKYWFLINSGERCFYQPRSGTRSGNNFSLLCAGSLGRTCQLNLTYWGSQWGSCCPSCPWYIPAPFWAIQTPFFHPISLWQHPVSCSLSLPVSGFAPNTLFSLWRNIFKSPGVAAVDNGNLLCFMCLENEFPCQKRRAITTSKRDQIGSLKRK